MRGARRCLEHGKASLKTIGYADLGTRKPHPDALVAGTQMSWTTAHNPPRLAAEAE